MNRSNRVKDVSSKNAVNRSRLIKAMEGWKEPLKSYETKPSGVFGLVAIVKSGGITINSDTLDLEFTVPFDDDMEANEAEIIVYNLTDDTIKQFKNKAVITIEAGYTGDTGVIFSGYISKVKTSYSGADKITTIKALDDVSTKTVESLSYAANTTASYILRDLLGRTGIPIAVFSVRRDHTYENETTVDGDLMQNIKKYAEVCGISVFVSKSKIYARYIKYGDNIGFTVEESTGMIESPEEFEEEQTAEDFKEVVKGYKVSMLLQHRMTTAAIVNIKSKGVNGQYRVRKGEHTFNADDGGITKIECI